mmetsp:Transcript_19714/g.59569  ORF Transcript_19714/g.59569 Transcript_19714/m.59569 type:complete len:258 (-) Transcript_19714:1007-1780(-)
MLPRAPPPKLKPPPLLKALSPTPKLHAPPGGTPPERGRPPPPLPLLRGCRGEPTGGCPVVRVCRWAGVLRGSLPVELSALLLLISRSSASTSSWSGEGPAMPGAVDTGGTLTVPLPRLMRCRAATRCLSCRASSLPPPREGSTRAILDTACSPPLCTAAPITAWVSRPCCPAGRTGPSCLGQWAVDAFEERVADMPPMAWPPPSSSLSSCSASSLLSRVPTTCTADCSILLVSRCSLPNSAAQWRCSNVRRVLVKLR